MKRIGKKCIWGAAIFIAAGVFYLISAGLIMSFTEEAGQPVVFEGPQAVRVSSASKNARAPYLTTNTQGQPVLSWVEGSDDPVMVYAVFDKQGEMIKQPQKIPVSKGLNVHNEMMPKMAFRPSGEIIAVWPVDNPSPENKYAGLTYYAQSFDGGKSWTPPSAITNHKSSNDQRYFDLAVLPNGKAGGIWLDNRISDPTGGSVLMYAETTGRQGFGNEKILARSTCQCCRTDIYIDAEGVINVAYRNIFGENTRDMAYIRSKDLGQSFSNPVRISYDNWQISACPHTGPSMAYNGEELFFYWFTMGDGEGVYSSKTSDHGRHFIERNLFSKKARHPQVATLTDSTIAIVWDEYLGNSNRVGLQLEGSDQQNRHQFYLSRANEDASYPVITALDDGAAFVAWVQKGNSSQIIYRVIASQ